jgi:hypothetical protein
LSLSEKLLLDVSPILLCFWDGNRLGSKRDAALKGGICRLSSCAVGEISIAIKNEKEKKA